MPQYGGAGDARKMGLKSQTSQRFIPTTTRADPTNSERALDQDFTAMAPDHKWVADITYLATA